MNRNITVSLILILSLATWAGAPAQGWAESSLPLTADQMNSITGGDFWGGAVCGAAAAGTAVGAFAIITAVGAGTTVGLGVAFAFSASAHVAALCAMID